jgi:hypothetical protein
MTRRREYGVQAAGFVLLNHQGHPLTRWQALKLARRLGGHAILSRHL